MKIITPRVVMLATALLGGGTFLASALPASAAPRSEWRNQGRRPGWNNRPGGNNRPGWNNRPGNNRPGWNNGSRTYTGQVTRVRSNDSFDIRVGGSTYNVYANSRLPRRLNVGDRVQVRGVRQDSNDIRYASVSIIRNR